MAGERIIMVSGEKSATGSYGSCLNSAAFTASVELLPMNTV